MAEKQKGASGRQSNFELLRIVAMFLIVAHHLQVHSIHNFEEDENKIPTHIFNKNFFNVLFLGGKVSVNIFLLLSGYFLNGKGVKLGSLMRTWIQAIVWSYTLFFLAYYSNRDLSEWSFFRGLFPIATYSYWFVSSYIAAMLLSSGTAIVSVQTSEFDLLTILTTQFLVMSVLSWNEYAFSHVFWFTYMTLLGASIRRFNSRLARVKTSTILFALVAVATISVSSILYFAVHPEIQWARDRGGATAVASDMNSPCALILAVLVFLLFSRINVQSDLINVLANCTLGVYFIHDNDIWREKLWHEIIRSHEYQNKPSLPLYCIFSLIMVYSVCSLLELARQWLMRDYEMRITGYVHDLVERSKKRLLETEPSEMELEEITLPHHSAESSFTSGTCNSPTK